MSAWSPPQLPPASQRGAYRIGVICLGNICRSPMAEVVLRRALADVGLGDRVVVESGGTGDWHLGEPMDARAAAALRGGGYDGSAHRAGQVAPDWFGGYDVLLAMDSSNYADLQAMAPNAESAARVLMFRAFDPEAAGTDLDVPDPYVGRAEDFPTVLALVERTARALADQLAAQLPRLLSA